MHNWREKKISKEKKNGIISFSKFSNFIISRAIISCISPPLCISNVRRIQRIRWKHRHSTYNFRICFVSHRSNRKKENPAILKTWTIESIHPFLSPLSLFFIFLAYLVERKRARWRGQRSSGNRLDKLGQLIINGREIQAIENQPRLKFN